MSKYKFSFCIIAVLLILIASLVPAFAHSGKTDSSGGHYDSSTGEYHYHHGYSAHSHPNGECPYTNTNSPTHSFSSHASPSTSSSGSENDFDFLDFFSEMTVFPSILTLISS